MCPKFMVIFALKYCTPFLQLKVDKVALVVIFRLKQLYS